jgi:hypothetical protein
MTTKVLISTVLGSAIVVGAAGGGYLARRHNDAGPRRIAEVPSTSPVEATEALVAPQERPSEAAQEPLAEVKPAPVVPATEPARPSTRTPKAEPTSRPPRQTSLPKVSETAAAAPVAATPAPIAVPPVTETAPAAVYEPTSVAAPESRRPKAEELTVTRDSVIGIRLETNIFSETARTEDKVVARVARDVTVDGHTAISSGSRMEGVVASVERGGKFKDRARIGVRFNSLVLADGTRLPIETETIFREGDSPTREAATKVGASAAIGGVLGAVIGGKKGAAIGSTVGAAGGTAAVMTGAPADIALPAGTALTVRLVAPVSVLIERQED